MNTTSQPPTAAAVTDKVRQLMDAALAKGYGEIQIIVTPDWIKIRDTSETFMRRTTKKPG
jgi:hypothetical protein